MSKTHSFHPKLSSIEALITVELELNYSDYVPLILSEVLCDFGKTIEIL